MADFFNFHKLSHDLWLCRYKTIGWTTCHLELFRTNMASFVAFLSRHVEERIDG